MKNATLNAFLWRWHVIAGILLMPIMFLLAVTGSIYLFQDKYESNAYKEIWEVPVGPNKASYQQQLEAATKVSGKSPEKMEISTEEHQATKFTSGRFSRSKYIYVNPYSAEVTGDYARADTLMQKVRKLHGELLLGKTGTTIIELAASWFVVLLLTGLYVWWPVKGFSIKGFFWVRTDQGRRILMRDLHAMIGFWASLVLIVILAGGLPWTDVFGSNFKTVQKWTNSGKPAHYSNSRGLSSTIEEGKVAFNLDQMVATAEQQQLDGKITIALPKNEKAVFTISNESHELDKQKVLHFDQYSGELVKSLQWSDVGALAAGRTITMRLHQGEYFGFANWLIILVTAISLAIASIAGLLSYLFRKPSTGLGIPRTPSTFVVGKFIIVMIIALGVLLPLFGLSVIVILTLQLLWSFIGRFKKQAVTQ